PLPTPHSPLALLCLASVLCFTLSFLCADAPTTELYTLSLHDALPIYRILKVDHPWRTILAVNQVARMVVAMNKHLRLLKRDIFQDRKSTRLNSSHVKISYAVFCLKKKSA